MYSVFDRNIVCNLYLFYFLSFMRTFVQLVADTPISIYQTEPTRVIRRGAAAARSKGKSKFAAAAAVSATPGIISRTADFREDEEEQEDEIDPHSRLYSADVGSTEKGQLVSDMDTLMGNKKALGQRVSELLVAYLRMIEKDKAAINFNLANIKEKLTRVKDKEKDGVVERIGAMSVGERQLENMMKTHKMGIWSRGTSQTGVVIYDQDYYDEERDEMEKIAQKERQIGRRDYVTDMNREIYVMDALEADRSAAEIEAHELDMSSGIPEDDDAGEDDTAYIHRHDDEGEAYEGGGGDGDGGD
jgi:Spy/CpxP family protein refolding chaperone